MGKTEQRIDSTQRNTYLGIGLEGLGSPAFAFSFFTFYFFFTYTVTTKLISTLHEEVQNNVYMYLFIFAHYLT